MLSLGRYTDLEYKGKLLAAAGSFLIYQTAYLILFHQSLLIFEKFSDFVLVSVNDR